METSVCSPSNLVRSSSGNPWLRVGVWFEIDRCFPLFFPRAFVTKCFSITSWLYFAVTVSSLYTSSYCFLSLHLNDSIQMLKARKEITPNGTFFLFLRLFIYLLFLAMLGLGSCTGVSLVAVCSIIMVKASLGEHGL